MTNQKEKRNQRRNPSGARRNKMKEEELLKENEMLEKLVSLVQYKDWDIDEIIKEVEKGNGIDWTGPPDLEFAEWLKKRK